jgi:hypothetical protein
MKRALIAALLAVAAAAAQAQPAAQPPGFTPLGPVQEPLPAPPARGAASAPATAPVQPVQSDWIAQGGFDLRALDKTTARAATLSGKVGETVRFGSLAITVRSCIVRPPDQAADAAAFLDIADSQGGPGFKGWMLLNEPQLAMLEHPGYDLRVAGCRP